MRGSHSVTYFLKTLLSNYDKEKFNILLISNNKIEDKTFDFFKKLVDKTINIFDKNDIEAINIIRGYEIDIIFDLMGVTSDHRLGLFKNRLAPVQISWCGYCNTTGLNQMDFIIADPNLVYKKEMNLYSEKVVFLPNIWNCHSGFNFKRIENPPPYLKNKYITFGSFNNFRKINDDVVSVWSEILRKIQNSKLILKASDSASTKILLNKFKQHGVCDSIEFIAYKKNFEDHMNLYQKIDVALDTFPYNGVTTSFEAIWMGVPVLTMKGYNFNSRCGESINANIDLNNFIAVNDKDYILKALKLSQNYELLYETRKKLFDQAISSPLFDKIDFRKNFFDLITNIYKKKYN
ncbi:hypothetical protein ACIJYE_06980 [Candidatus Pelagibacter bacterium nBUS_30]|uniref:O-linked N-acetylglucosamine transferase, SPINDLY family protein n=1 Tax=Candidatus Pelagibacter bacterium nBUS_30 TaxID=3374191 RepID=UPI003EBE2FF7